MKRHKRTTSGVNGVVRYAPYLRCSDDDQAHGDFTTIDSQNQHTNRHITQRGGVALPPFIDEGKSGTNLNRAGWKRLLLSAQAGDIDCVAITYMSRLGRGDSYTVAEYLLREAGVHVEMVQENFGEGVSGYVAKKATNLMDGLYPVMVSGWVKTKQSAMVSLGYYPGAQVPFGYKTEPVLGMFGKDDKEPPRRLVPDNTAVCVVKCYEMFLATGSISEVRSYLRSVAPDANRWFYASVRHLLSNDTYRGVQVWGANRNETAHEPIVADYLFAAVQEALLAHQDGPTNRAKGYQKENRADTTAYFLRGLVRCACCGSMMSPADHHGRSSAVRYYECTSVLHNNGTSPCPIKRVNAFTLHELVVAEIARAGQDKTRLQYLIEDAAQALPRLDLVKQEAETLRIRENEHSTKLVRLTEALERGAAMDTLLTRMATLEAELKTIRHERQQAELRLVTAQGQKPDTKRIASYWQHFGFLWNEATEEERGDLLPLIVESVTMTGRVQSGERYGEVRLKLDAPHTVRGTAEAQSGLSVKQGSLCWIRTSDILINSQALCQLS